MRVAVVTIEKPEERSTQPESTIVYSFAPGELSDPPFYILVAMKQYLKISCIVLLNTLLLSGCYGTKRLDEQIFYEGPEMTLKLVRYYRNLFLSFNGEVYSVQCRSSETAGNSAERQQDPGWQTLSTGAALGSKSAQEVVNYLRDEYLIMDERTVVKIWGGISVSFDACRTLHHWSAVQLPLNLINQLSKPDYCEPKGTADCRHYDFQDDRAPVIADVRADSSGRISFVARSKAFKDGAVYRIESQDSGRSWGYTRIVVNDQGQD